MKVVKFGGSVISPSKNYIDVESISYLAEALHGEKEIIVVHGAGGMGHPYVTDGLSTVIQKMNELNVEVVRALNENGLNPIPIHPYQLKRNEISQKVYEFLDEFTPVTYGTMDAKGRIISGDDIVKYVAINSVYHKFDLESVIFVTDVEGIYEPSNNELIRRMNLFELNIILPRVNKHTNKAYDVTGGMYKKLKDIHSILERIDLKVYIVNKENLENALNGHNVGTIITRD